MGSNKTRPKEEKRRRRQDEEGAGAPLPEAGEARDGHGGEAEEGARKNKTRRGGRRGKKAEEHVNPHGERALKSGVDIGDLFVSGGDLKSMGRAVTGPFTAEALAARYKETGATVAVDPTFDFKDLVLDTQGATWSLGGGETGDAVGGAGPGKSVDAKTTTNPATAAGAESRDDVVNLGGGEGENGGMGGDGNGCIQDSAEAAAAARRVRAKAVACARRAASDAVDAWSVMGLSPAVLEYGRGFVRAAPSEEEMVEEWHKSRDAAREDYKRRRRQALRNQKTNRTGGMGSV